MSNDMLINDQYVSDLCRVCLKLPEKSQYLDLNTIYDEEDHLTYAECFGICTRIDLSVGDNVPRHLCKPCGLELQMSYDFHKKVQESSRLIEQCQRQITVKTNTDSLQTNGEKSKTENLNTQVSTPFPGINQNQSSHSNEERLHEPSEEIETCIIQQENGSFIETLNENDEAAEMEFLRNMCHTADDIHNQETSHGNELLIQSTKEDDNIEVYVEDHLEMEGYQNLEALEDEETETIQIIRENTIPAHVNEEELLEYAENKVVKKDEELGYEEYAIETNEEDDTDDQSKWQENVVAIANKEHLPIKIVANDKELGTKMRLYKIMKCKKDDSHVIKTESSQDEAIEDEDRENKEASDSESNTNNENSMSSNSAGRKRHIGTYSCDYCHRVYPNYSRMKTHRRCHEVDRPKFSCSHCGRMYATKQARDCHIQTAHDKSGHTCSICGKVFAIRKSLEIHIRYHTGYFPYACKLCDKKFAQACHLNTHINVKHNKIRFSCDFPNCGKYFTSSSSLRNHEYTHGVMPFECEFCQQGYPAKSKLRVHIQRKHGVDMSSEELENMRKFHVMRSKVNLVQFVDK